MARNSVPGVSAITDLGAGSLSGILKASSGSIVAAVADTDYVSPATTSTITGAKTFSTTSSVVISAANPAIANWQNPTSAVNSGLWTWRIGGPGNSDGDLRLINGSTEAHFSQSGLTYQGSQSFGLGINGSLQNYANGNTAIYCRSSGWDIYGVSQINLGVGSLALSVRATTFSSTLQTLIGATSAGSANAQLESHAASASANILAGYTSAGGAAAFLVDPKGIPILPAVADASIPNGGIAWSTDTPNSLKCRTPGGTLKTFTLT